MRSDPSPPRASSPGERGRRRRRLLQLGILSGDVSVTAGCATLPFWGALIVGAIGGLVNRGFGQLVQRLKARAAPHALLLPLLLPNPSPPPPPLSPSGRWMTRSRRLLSTGRSRRLMWSSTRMEAAAHAHRAARRVNQLGRTRRHSKARVYRYFGAFRSLQIVQNHAHQRPLSACGGRSWATRRRASRGNPARHPNRCHAHQRPSPRGGRSFEGNDGGVPGATLRATQIKPTTRATPTQEGGRGWCSPPQLELRSHRRGQRCGVPYQRCAPDARIQHCTRQKPPRASPTCLWTRRLSGRGLRR